VPKFGDAAVRALRARQWKGNVRELQNVVEHMVVMLEAGAEITPETIPALHERPGSELGATWAPTEVSTEEPYYVARDRLVAEFELRYLTQLVTQARGNMSKAARTAGVDRTTLYRLMERHGLHRGLLKPSEGD
jgi:DNA-binding NtrC family response regulator